MTSEQDIRDMSDAIGRGLSANLAAERDTPDRLKLLLRQLKLADEQLARASARNNR
jgi:hypothetical protein